MAIEKVDTIRLNGRIEIIKHEPAKVEIIPKVFDRYVNDYYDYIRGNALAHKDIKTNEEIKSLNVAIMDRMLKAFEIERKVYENVTCTVGRTEIAKALANNSPVATYLEYCAVGTGAGVPAVSDTILFTELYRKTFALTNQSSNVVTIRTFFTTSEANGTLTEIGYFMDDATAAADSGTMFDHATISETKTSSMTLTAILTLTIADA